jgi:hypothetical protein
MPPTQTESRRLAALYIILGAIVLVPVLTVQVPCLGDMLNHLARIHVLSTIGQSAVLQTLYEPRWKLVPYLGMDVPVALLARIMPIYVAGKIFAAICVLVPVLSAVSLRLAASGRVGAGTCVAYLLSYNYLLERGFLTYLFGALCALLLFALWVASARRAGVLRSAVFSVLFLGVFLAHSFAAAAYCLLVAGHEIGLAGRAGFSPVRRIATRWGLAAAQILPALVLAVVLAIQGHEVTRSHFRFANALDQLGALLSPVFFAGNPATLPILALFMTMAVGFRRHLRLAPALWPAAALMAVVACFTPSVLFDVTWGVNLRLPLVVAIVLIASVCLARPVGVWPRRLALAAVFILVAVTSFNARATLAALDGQVATMRALVSVLPLGSRLLVLDMPTACGVQRVAPRDLTAHLAFVAAIDRDAFIPFLFTGTTPLQVRPALRNSASPIAEAVSEAQLAEGLMQNDPPGGPPGYGWGGHVYWLGWPHKFDYLLVQHFGCAGFQPPAVVTLVERSAIADLYRIKRGSEAR